MGKVIRYRVVEIFMSFVNCDLGYLSSRLALEYKLRVLGIDANSENSENALKRNARLQVIV